MAEGDHGPSAFVFDTDRPSCDNCDQSVTQLYQNGGKKSQFLVCQLTSHGIGKSCNGGSQFAGIHRDHLLPLYGRQGRRLQNLLSFFNEKFALIGNFEKIHRQFMGIAVK